MDGTCIWIKENASYKSWLCTGSRLLWLSGGPGKGKTMLSIFLSEELESLAKQSHSAIFLEYFCDNKDDRRNSAIAILRGLLYQLLESRPGLYKYVMAEFRNQGEKLLSSFPSLWNIFRNMLKDPDLETVYCVLDGLDECDGDSVEWLLHRLKSLFSTDLGPNAVCHLKMIIVSRDLPDFLAEVLSSFPHITLDLDADAEINYDVHRFIEDKINEISKIKRYPHELSVHVKDVFRKQAQGTFLWIGIAAQKLREYTVTGVEEALNSLPSGLEPLFARMLLQIKPERRQIIAQIFRWVVLAARPLNVSELSIAIKQSNHDRDSDNVVAFSREEITRDHIRNCGFLLSITKDTVDLVHQSVKDYLLRNIGDSNAELESFRVKEDEGNLELARQCFYYLQDVALVDEPPVKDPEIFKMSSARRENLPKEFPLLSYAMQYWPMHASALNHNDDIFDLSQQFYKDPKFCAIWRKMYLNFDSTKGQRIPFNLLHIASYFNLKVLANNVISTYHTKNNKKSPGAKDQINEPNASESTALHIAAKHGFEVISRLLLNNEAYVDARDNCKRTALHVAVNGGHRDVARLLLDEGASTEAPNLSGETALHCAIRSDHIRIVRLLLDRGASIETKNSSEETPLHYATRGEHSEVVELLLDRGASTEAKDLSGETPLHYAARDENSVAVKLLLNRGASTEAKNLSEETPLHCAARGKPRNNFERHLADKDRHLAIVQLLLDKAASTKAKNSSKDTPLHCAIGGKHSAVVRLLLDRGASIEAANKHGRRPLHIAASLGLPAMAQLLLRHKADITAKDKDEYTPLHFAAESGDQELVRLLLNENAFIEAKNKFRMTTLHVAAKYGRSDVVEVLLSNKASVNSRDCDGWTALHYAAQYNARATVEILLESGADLEVKCKEGKTALHRAAKMGCMKIVLVLLDEGASIDAQDKSDCTAVHYAVKERHTSTLRHLLIRGASTEIRNCNGLTALEEARIDNNMPVVRLIEKFQNNVNANE